MKTNLKIFLSAGLLAVTISACKKQQEELSDNSTIQVVANNKLKTQAIYNYDALINKEIAYILSCQLSSGAIKMYPANSNVNAYFANVACLGLLEKPTTANVAAVKSWMAWYMTHLNGTTNPVKGGSEIGGSVYDYSYDGTTLTSLGTYDSIDSYAATFLTLAKRLVEISPANNSWLAGYSYQLTLIGNALTACIDNSSNTMPVGYTPDDNDGLTIDSYVHGAKYLMDNVEVNEGFRSMVWLQSNVITGGSPAYYQSVLTAHTSAIESQLWRSTMYNWNDNGTTGATNSSWSTWYADAIGQLFPVMLGLIDPTSSRAVSLYSTFNTNYPNWSTGTVYDPSGFPTVLVAYAAAKMNDVTGATNYLNYLQTYSGTTEPSHWYVAESGFSILAASLMNNVEVNVAKNKTATASSNSSTAYRSNDGDISTRWSSAVADNEWWKVDLGTSQSISKVVIKWEGAYATSYTIQTSADDVTFTNAYTTTTGDGGTDTLTFAARNARYVRVVCNTRVQSIWGSSFWEVEVY